LITLEWTWKHLKRMANGISRTKMELYTRNSEAMKEYVSWAYYDENGTSSFGSLSINCLFCQLHGGTELFFRTIDNTCMGRWVVHQCMIWFWRSIW
jgi:hypothetical protein